MILYNISHFQFFFNFLFLFLSSSFSLCLFFFIQTASSSFHLHFLRILNWGSSKNFNYFSQRSQHWKWLLVKFLQVLLTKLALFSSKFLSFIFCSFCGCLQHTKASKELFNHTSFMSFWIIGVGCKVKDLSVFREQKYSLLYCFPDLQDLDYFSTLNDHFSVSFPHFTRHYHVYGN